MNLFTLFGTIAIENADAINAIAQTTNKAESSSTKIGKAFSGIGSAAVSMGKIALTGFAALTAGFIALGTAAVDYNAEMEQYNTSFEVMLGSEAEALALVEDLKEKAASTPFEMQDLASTTQLLLNYGLSAEQATDKMMMLGDIAQGDAEKMNRIASAYGQMSSAGKVSLEDIKQMIEAGFNPLQEISETTGESMESLYDRISKGTISIDEITASMERSTAEGGKYFQSMEKQSQTLNGKISTLKDTVQNELGKAFSSVSDVLVSDIVPSLTSMAEKYIPKLGGVVEKILPPFMDFANMALPLVMDALDSIIPLFIQFTEEIMPLLGDTLQMMLPFLIQIIQSILPVLFELIQKLLPPFMQICESLLPIVVRLLDILLPPLLQIVDLALPLLMKILSPLLELLAPLIELLSPILQIVIALLEPLLTLVDFILTPILEYIGWIAELISTHLVPIMLVVASCISETLTKALELVKPILDSLQEKFSVIFGKIKGVIEPVITWIKDNLIEKFQEAKDTAVSIFETMKETFSEIFEDGIWGTIKGAINNILGGIETLVNGVIDGINTLIGGIDTVVSEVGEALGVEWSVPTIDNVTLPRLYNGGVLEKGQVGLLEGSGAEAVVPLENNSKWISAVAEDMEGIAGKGSTQTLLSILEELRELNESLVDKFIEALVNGAIFRVDNREFGRMVRAVN